MMIRSLWTGATGMNAMQDFIDSIGHDLTNVNTNGYKKRHLNFQDLYYQTVRAAGIQGADPGVNIPVGVEIGNGVRLAATTPVFVMGNPLQTGVPTNLMITDTTSFFSLTMPDGRIAYTRDGSFTVDNNGEVRNSSGYPLNPPIAGLPTGARDVTFTPGGQLQYVDENGAIQQVGPRVGVYNFINPAGLHAEGGNLWFESAASGPATAGNPGDAGFGTVQGGWIEGSNVDAVTEMVNMISAQRAYEFNSRTIQTADSMLQTVASLKR
ncbi:flagellar basal body rod protein FlgG [Planctomycetales bacterium]|jgi:flagellar basal-body rod protein FlgG|nr:flagellar basal-body rod protein FlgG [Planctomycetota bacterium]GHS92299.1 flagellar basal body rod protein FlgG [Planctomycetales bacterium]GHV20882.1 flagellar basal body rod protein FlgG [Planctomycetales bacterium]